MMKSLVLNKAVYDCCGHWTQADYDGARFYIITGFKSIKRYVLILSPAEAEKLAEFIKSCKEEK